MKAKRLWWTIRTTFIKSGRKRADYARRNNIYAHVGENVSIQSRVIPIYSELISLHNNVAIARNVDFCTHDIIHVVLNRMDIHTISSPLYSTDKFKFKEHVGCIEIMDNVFIGSNSVILYDTKIGPNVIIASGSVVVKDCEPNSVYAGVPARKIAKLSDYINKRIVAEKNGDMALILHNETLTEKEIEDAWRIFYENRR